MREHGARVGSECEANPNLAALLQDSLCEHAVKAETGHSAATAANAPMTRAPARRCPFTFSRQRLSAIVRTLAIAIASL